MARSVCKLKYLTGAAPVVYGIRRCYESNDFLRTLQTVEDVVWQLLCLVFFSFYLLSGIHYQIMPLLAHCISYPFFSYPVFHLLHSHLWTCYASHGLSFVHLLEPAVYLSAHINGPVLPKWVLVLRFIPLLTQFYTTIMGKINIELRFHNKCLSPSVTFSDLRSTLNKSICWNRQNVGLM